MKCRHCNEPCIRKGVRSGIQKYRCKSCFRYQQEVYTYKKISDRNLLIQLNNEGMSISSIARILQVSKTSVCRKLHQCSKQVVQTRIEEIGQEYELDELYTYTGNKDNECWIMYAINKSTRRVIECVVGKRTTENIKKVVDKVLDLQPKKVYTDLLNIYPALIPQAIHKAARYRTNRIERMNLNLRTHLKRLSRKTICFSRSQAMLEVTFWGEEKNAYDDKGKLKSGLEIKVESLPNGEQKLNIAFKTSFKEALIIGAETSVEAGAEVIIKPKPQPDETSKPETNTTTTTPIKD
jgi:insertion element IS1 protein InsB